MDNGEELTRTRERYLEAIYHLQQERGVARPRDIAEMTGVHKSTVTFALRGLSELGLVDYEAYEPVTLTEAGERRARRLADRHRVISRFLERMLGIAPQMAERNACRMEHYMDPQVLERMVCLLAFLEQCPERDTAWLAKFETFAEQTAGRSCEEWIEQYLDKVGRGKAPAPSPEERS